MMFNYFFKEVKDLLIIDGETYVTYKKAYNVCILIYNHDNNAYEDVIKLGNNNKFKLVDNNKF